MQTLKLIAIYYYVCDKYTQNLRWHNQRFSSNSFPSGITDQELITIYLFCMIYQQRYTIKSMHNYIYHHWRDWFPDLPSYQTFNDRLIRLHPCFEALCTELCGTLKLPADALPISVGDSMPIITCTGNRKGKVAPRLTDKGYCATKKLHYFGVKLHVLALRVAGSLPLPKTAIVTPASVHDLNALRDCLEQLKIPAVLDKAYCDSELEEKMKANGSCLLTPIKWKKGMPEALKQFDKAYVDLFGTAIAKIRQPIEALFAWLQEKTNIQNASKVRSDRGLMLHMFGRFAAALFIFAGF